jgi:hypothetical protein
MKYRLCKSELTYYHGNLLIIIANYALNETFQYGYQDQR